MKLRDQILKEHTKENCLCIVEWVGDDLKKFDELFHLFLHDEYRVVQRAAWPLSICVTQHPHFINGKFGKILNHLKKPGIHDSVKRNTVRFLEHIPLPEKYEGAIMDICFSYVASPREPVAVKAFSLGVLEKLAIKYPEILPELKLIIEDQLPHQSAAFKGRAKKLLQKIK